MHVTEETIEIAFSVHDALDSYHEYLWIALASILENTDAPLHIHILCDETLLPHARGELRALCDAHGQMLTFHDITLNPRVDMRRVLLAGYSEGILYRLYLPELLPDVNKIIYLDADVLVQCDIRTLWATEMGGYAAAGRWDPPWFGCRQEQVAHSPAQYLEYWEKIGRREHYVNSGVLVMNLEKLRREHDLPGEALVFWETYGVRFPDQDALNYILHGQIKLLPGTMNLPVRRTTTVRTGVIYHYLFYERPDDILSPTDKLYLSYWERSPYYHPEYGRREKAEYMCRMKEHLDVMLRLRDLGLWSCYDVLTAAQHMMHHRRFAEAAACLRDETTKHLPVTRGGTTCLEGDDATLWDLRRQHLLVVALERMTEREEALSVCREALEHFDLCGALASSARELLLEQMIILWNDTGRLKFDLGDFTGAAKAWRNSLDMDPIWGTGYSIHAVVRLVKCMLRLGDLDEAERYNNILFAIQPDSGVPALNAVKIAFERRQREKGTSRA